MPDSAQELMTGEAELAIRRWLYKHPPELIIRVLYNEGFRMAAGEWSTTEAQWVADIDCYLSAAEGEKK